MSGKWNARGHAAGEAAKRPAEAAANDVKQVTAVAVRNDGRAADGAQAKAQAAGAGLDKAGLLHCRSNATSRQDA